MWSAWSSSSLTRSWAINAMKRGLLAGTLALSVLLTGCSALLERDYSHITPHNAAPTTEGDPSILRAESYQELVNALVYLVNIGADEGTIRLYTDSENVESFLADACLEVVQEDPLGAYCVEFIKYSVDPVVTYSQAQVDITYRRTREQVASIAQVTGITAIRSELSAALTEFSLERTLRIRYFEEDNAFIQDLVRQAYYDVPAFALGMPEVSVSLYPDSGRQRIVEILLNYPLDHAELEERHSVLADRLEKLALELESLSGQDQLLAAAQTVQEAGVYDPQGGSTAYDLFQDGAADSEGLSLAFAALCQRLALPCQVAQGTVSGEPRFWTVVQTEEGWRHLDLTVRPPDAGSLHTDLQLQELGFHWDDASLPFCV